MRAAGFGLCLLLAVGLHVAVALRLDPVTGGSAAAGDEGRALVSLAAAPEQIAALVRRWDTPPDPVPAAPTLPAQPDATLPDTAPPDAATSDTAPAAPALPLLAQPMAEAPALPDRAMAQTAAPRDAPRRSPRPPARPDPVSQPQSQPTSQPRRTPPDQPAPQSSQPAQPAQRASGSGGGGAAGARQQDRAATLSPAQQQSLQARWGARIRQQIERRKRYPRAARGATGRAVVMVTVARDGGLRGVSLAASAGHPALDQAAVQSVRAAGRFPAAPQGLGAPSYSFRLPIGFDR